MQKIEQYRPSGDFDASTLAYGIPVGVASAVLLAWLYQTTITWVPLIYLNVVATVGFGLAVGWIVARAIVHGKCRSRALAVVIGLVAGGVGEAAAFHFSYQRFTTGVVASNHQALENLREELQSGGLVGEEQAAAAELIGVVESQPMSVASFRSEYPFSQYVVDRAEMGWTVGTGAGLPIAGWLVWLVWLLEAGIIVGLTVAVPYAAVHRPFCEACHAWTGERMVRDIAGVDTDVLRAAVRRGDLDALLDPGHGAGHREHAQYLLQACARCPEPAFVTVVIVSSDRDKRGKVTVKEDVVVRHATLSVAHRSALEAPPTASARAASGAAESAPAPESDVPASV